MKKLFTTILCLGLMSVNLTCFADEASQVKVSCINVPLKSNLHNKYSAYKIEFFNEGQTPVRANEVRCYNRIAVADTNEYNDLPKGAKYALALSPLTLGLSGLLAIPSMNKTGSNLKDVVNEAKRYNALDFAGLTSGNCLLTTNEILSQGQSIQFNVLVPLNENPEIVGSFEELVSHKYIRVQNTK